MNALKRFLKNTKGNFSILFVILVMIAVLVVAAFLDIVSRSWTIQEVQSVMDVAGVSALRTGVDETKLRLEQFDVDANVVESSYIRMITNQLEGSSKINDFRFIRTKVTKYNENWGMGQASKARPQAMIDSTVIITVEANPLFDLIPGTARWFYDSKSQTNFQVTYNGQTQDGEVELTIRSVSRIVYR